MMAHWLRLVVSLWSALVLLVGTVLVAHSESPAWAAGQLIQEPTTERTFAEGCTTMDVSDPALWFATDEEGDVDTDQVVDAYPSGVTAIAAGFEYDCVPPKTTLVTVVYALSFDEDPWFSDETKLSASSKGGIAYYPIMIRADKAIPDGEYRAEFYVDEELLTSGEVTVGESEVESQSAQDWFQKDEEEPQPTEQQEQEKLQPTEQQEEEQEQNQDDAKRHEEEQRQRENKVQIEGTIMDGYTDLPIRGAVFIVLHPGISVSQWADYGYPPSDIMSTSETDRDGKFRHPGVDRNVEYSVIAWALSYQGWYQDGFEITDDDPDPYELTITLVR